MWIVIIILILIIVYVLWRLNEMWNQKLSLERKNRDLQADVQNLTAELTKKSDLQDSDALSIEEAKIILDDDTYYTFSDFWNFIYESKSMEIREMNFDDDYKRQNLEYLLAVIAKAKENESRLFYVRLITDYSYGERSGGGFFADEYNNYSPNWLDNLVEECKEYEIKLNISYEKNNQQSSFSMKFYIDNSEWRVFSKTGLDIFEIDDSSILPHYCHSLVHNRKGKITIKEYNH